MVIEMKNSKKIQKVKRPQSLSVCLAVAQARIDSFQKKSAFVTMLRKDTERRAKFYADQMNCSVEELSQAILEYFVWIQMENTNSDNIMNLGNGKKVQIRRFVEEEKVNRLDDFL